MEKEDFQMLAEKLESDTDFYKEVAGLCILAVAGLPEKLRKSAANRLEHITDSNIRISTDLTSEFTGISLTFLDDSEAYSLKKCSKFIISIPSGYRFLRDISGEVYLSSVN